MKTCKCGNEIKDGKHPKMCYSCLCAKEVMKKGVEHTPSHKAVKGLKHISLFGIGWAEKLLFSKR